MPEAGQTFQGPGPDEAPGQSTIEEQLAQAAASNLEDQLAAAQADAGTLGTVNNGAILDAAASFEPGAPVTSPSMPAEQQQSAREFIAATDAASDANSSENGGRGDGNPDVLQMITRPGSSTMHVDTEVTYDTIYASIGKQAQDRNVYGLAQKLSQLGYLDGVLPIGQQYYPRKAVAAFQVDAGLRSDGRYTRETHDKIFSI